MKSTFLKTAALAATFLCGMQGAWAQEIVKQVDRDGHVIFTDRPDPQARTLVRYAALSFPKADSIEQPSQEPAAPLPKPLSDVEQALSNMTIISSPRAMTLDAIEASRRIRNERMSAWQGTPSLSAMLVATDSAGSRDADLKKISVEEDDSLLVRVLSTVLYLFFAVGLGFMAYVSARIIRIGLLPAFRQLLRRVGKMRAVQ